MKHLLKRPIVIFHCALPTLQALVLNAFLVVFLALLRCFKKVSHDSFLNIFSPFFAFQKVPVNRVNQSNDLLRTVRKNLEAP